MYTLHLVLFSSYHNCYFNLVDATSKTLQKEEMKGIKGTLKFSLSHYICIKKFNQHYWMINEKESGSHPPRNSSAFEKI